MKGKTLAVCAILSAVATAWNQSSTPIGPLQPGPGELPCQFGDVQLAWELPAGSFNGFAVGVAWTGPTWQYGCTLSSTDLSQPGSSLAVGTLQGVLDDGVGVSPDYLVQGSFNGSNLTGLGQFRCRIYDPVSGACVGTMQGRFDDPISAPGQYGVASGVWRICD